MHEFLILSARNDRCLPRHQEPDTGDVAVNVLALFRRKECWRLTPLGWAIILVGLICFIVWLRTGMHPFLALDSRVSADALVVEGWLPDYALEGAVKEYQAHPYKCIISTGGPIEAGSVISGYKTYAALGAETLVRLGVDSAKVFGVPAPRLQADRTYASAVALRRWLAVSGAEIRSVNLYSLGAHTRRSRLLFQKALGASFPVGSIPAKDLSYDPERWWLYSNGVEAMIFETVGYLYVKILFPFGAEHALDAQ